MPLHLFKLTLAWVKDITPNVRHFAFSHEQSGDFPYIPGQFITLHFTKHDKKLRRSYSLASAPGESNYLEFAAGFVPEGPGTRLLFGLKVGDSIEAAGPFGRLILQDNIPSRYILTATSTGVTPFRTMLPELAKRITEHELKVVLLLGVKKNSELLYGNDFIEFAKRYTNFTFRAQYSREMPEQAQDYEYSGYVQSAFPALQLDPEADIVYLCGNPSMIDEAFKDLQTRGFPIQHIRREKYISGK